MAAAAAGIGASTGGGVSTIEGHLRGTRGSGGGSLAASGKLTNCFPALMRSSVPSSATYDSMTGLLSAPAGQPATTGTSCAAAAPAAALTSNHVRQLLLGRLQQQQQQHLVQSFSCDEEDEYDTCTPSVIYDDEDGDETIMSTGTLRH